MLAAILSFTAEGKKRAGEIEKFLREIGCETVREHFGKEKEAVAETTNCGEYPEGSISGHIRGESRQEGIAGETGSAPEKLTAAEFTGRMFLQARLLIFVGACGIAVRLIAPHVRDKKTDPAVLAVDELGKYVIPILSGHLGGANRYARRLADALGAEAVITTATDLNGRFAPDLFAEKYHFKIRSMKDAKAVAAAGLERDVEIVFDVPWEGELPPEPGAFYHFDRVSQREKNQNPDVHPRVLITNAEKTEQPGALQCVLTPQNLIVGIGCRRGIETEIIISFLQEVFEQKNLATEAICCISSIDRKRDEPGLVAAAETLGVPFYTYSAEELNSLSGTFTASEFVKRQMGTDNVCERSAAMAGIRWNGERGRFPVRKQAKDGVTLAVFEVPVKLV